MVGFVIGFVGFGVLLIWGAVRSLKRDKELGVVASYDGLKLTDTHLLVGSASYSLEGVHAMVEDSGSLSKRITATRLVATGVIALAWRKRVDDRSVFLTVEGPGVAIVREVRVEKDKNAPALARSFAAALNSRAAALGMAPPSAGGVTSVAEQLANVAVMHERGQLSDEEFAAVKREILGGEEPQDEASQW